MNNLAPIGGGDLSRAGRDPWQEAIESWLKAAEGRTGSKHTRRAYERAITDWLEFLAQLGRHPSQAGGVEVNAWRDELREAGKAPATVAQRLAAVSSFYRYCQHKFTLQDQAGRHSPHRHRTCLPKAG